MDIEKEDKVGKSNIIKIGQSAGNQMCSCRSKLKSLQLF